MGGIDISLLRWAFSPCPNDTFIFGALVNGFLPGIAPIVPWLEDIQALNGIAREGGADVVKVSAAACPAFFERYEVLPCGGAMGVGVGPLLIRSEEAADRVSSGSVVAHPGDCTTAYALFRLFHPEVMCFREMLFSDIENAVRRGEVSHGLLIHEGRFTYRQHNLYCEEDLGECWEREYALPLPLGVILLRRELSMGIKKAVARSIVASIDYGWSHPKDVMPYVAAHAQEMDSAVQQQHINLYVNDYSRSIGSCGERALCTLWGGAGRCAADSDSGIFFRG